MSRVKIDLKSAAVPDKLQRARYMITKLTDNPAFPKPQPTLLELKNIINKLDAAYFTALDGKMDHKYALRTVNFEFNQIFDILFNYIQMESKSDRKKIESAGCEVRKSKNDVSIKKARKVKKDESKVISLPNSEARRKKHKGDTSPDYKQMG